LFNKSFHQQTVSTNKTNNKTSVWIFLFMIRELGSSFPLFVSLLITSSHIRKSVPGRIIYFICDVISSASSVFCWWWYRKSSM